MSATISTNDIYRGENTSRVLTAELANIEQAIDALDGAKAPVMHSHADLESAIDGLENGKAESIHTHEMTAITGLNAKLGEIDNAIAALQEGSGSSVPPMLVASMHLGKLDNNSGAEIASSTRICSDPFPVKPGTSYWQVNDKGVNMYVLFYDADELFIEYMGSFASGAEIAVLNQKAAYMRIGSLIGEYDLSNEFRIYDVNPDSGSGDASGDGYTKEEADSRFAPVVHTHDGYAASSHKHTAEDITGLPSSVDAYSKTEADGRFAAVSHTHPGYAAENHVHNGYAPSGHTHSGYFPADGGTISGDTNIDGILRVRGQQAYYFSGNSQTIGTNNATGGTTIGCGSGANAVVNGANLMAPNIKPRNGGSFTLGESANRWAGIYSKASVNVASDERLKRDVAAVDGAALARFINALCVVAYNYTDDAEGAASRIGVIAQDVRRADSEISKFFVSEDENGILGLAPADLVFPLISAVQALSARVSKLEINK